MQQKQKKGVAAGETPHFLKFINETTPGDISLKNLNEAPSISYELDHIYGFAGDRNKSCLYFGQDNNEIVFMAASVGIIQDLNTRKQRFFGGLEKNKYQKKYEKNWPVHQDDISDLHICQTPGQRNLVCTGEVGKRSTIHIWDVKSMKSVSSVSLGDSAKGIAALSLSPCQRYVAAVDKSNDHNMSIYNVSKKKMIVQVSAGTDSINDICWSKKPNDLRFSAVTSRSLQFWHPADATKKLFKNGTFGSKFPQTKFNCATFDEEGLCFSGGANGNVHCWDQRGELGLVLKAHAAECTAIVAAQGMLISTGKDFKLTIHTADGGQFEYVKQINLNVFFHASSIDYMDGKILVGHDNGRICTVDINGENIVTVNTSHHDGECWGLEIIQETGTFLTCGDDNEFHEFTIRTKELHRSGKIWTNDLNEGKSYKTEKIKSTASTLCEYPSHQQGRAIAYDRLHQHVAVSNNYGDVSIFDYSDFSARICVLFAPKEWVEVLKYSPNGQFLAVGAHDDTIYIYHISEEGKYSSWMKYDFIHSSAITGMDWSQDSKYLRAIDQAYGKQYYNIPSKSQEMDGANILTHPSIWETATCKLGWDMMGVFPLGADGTDVNSVDCNKNRTLVAAADDNGCVCVYKYPCVRNTQECRRISGHSEHVTRCKFYENEFDKDNACIITAGGMDRCYIQWKPVLN